VKISTLIEATVKLPKTQEQILDAAIYCVKQWGMEKVSLNDIAVQARVARSTVYKYYKNCDEVVRSSLLRSAFVFGEKLHKHFDQFETPEERLIEAIMFSLQSLPEEPSFNLLSPSALNQLTTEHTLTTPEGLDMGTALFALIMNDRQFSDEELAEVSEFSIRFLLSLLTMEMQVKRDEEQLRGFIARRLLPSIGLSVPEQYRIFS